MEMIEVKQQEEADMIKSHSQLPMYNTVMEVKVEGKLKLSQKDTGGYTYRTRIGCAMS